MTNKEAKRLKEEEMKILDDFIIFCEKNKLDYQLSYGTLLGAIRHKGFIPWDDDVDIHMSPKDYLRFLELYKDNDDDRYILQNIDTEKYYHAYFSKIRKNNTCMIEKDWQYVKIHKGINIDIFPLFPYPDDKFDRFLMMLKFRISSILTSKNLKGKSLKAKIIFGCLRIIPRTITNKIASKLMMSILTYKGEYSQYKVELHDKPIKVEWVKKSISVPFEDREYKVPSKYDEILKTFYGDYMQLPKEEDRIGHGDIILSFDKNYEDIVE